jgi:hypothetical protein
LYIEWEKTSVSSITNNFEVVLIDLSLYPLIPSLLMDSIIGIVTAARLVLLSVN